MELAAQLKGSDLRIFIEGESWKIVTKPFYKEKVKIGLSVFYVRGATAIFHDAINTKEPYTHPSLRFCREDLTVREFNERLGQAKYGEPYEIRLGNSAFGLKKEFPCAYTLTFYNYSHSATYLSWLTTILYTESDLLLKRLLTHGRYFSSGFSEFKEFDSIEAFIDHKFGIWYKDTVEEFEIALLK